MKREIRPILQINCKKKKCGNCHGVVYEPAPNKNSSDSHWCGIYEGPLPINEKGKLMRLDICMKDEAVVDEIYPGEEEAYKKDCNPDDEEWEVT
ncbi:MAG: hypothetical protein WC319_05590 [Candidatus Paceibacterota bacterium]|jgi:hypothetical protein